MDVEDGTSAQLNHDEKPSQVFQRFSQHHKHDGFGFLFSRATYAQWNLIDSYYKGHNDPCPKYACMLTRLFELVKTVDNIKAIILVPDIFAHPKLDTGLALEIPPSVQVSAPNINNGSLGGNYTFCNTIQNNHIVLADAFYRELQPEEYNEVETTIIKTRNNDYSDVPTVKEVDIITLERHVRANQKAHTLDFAWWARKGILVLPMCLSAHNGEHVDRIPKRQKQTDKLPHSPWYVFVMNIIEYLHKLNNKLVYMAIGVEAQEVVHELNISDTKSVFASWFDVHQICNATFPFSQLLTKIYYSQGIKIEPSLLAIQKQDDGQFGPVVCNQETWQKYQECRRECMEHENKYLV